ncbi:MAG: DUF2076 family protein [Gammaproteobacteria bacterium]|nr:DUF2076 family protein [Gammaproteobacteria bacterium]
MNSQEREDLSRFLAQLTEVRLAEKDREAESLISDAVARQPDAAYLLVQRAMLVEQALNSAKSRIAELQQGRRPESSNGEGGFLAGRNPWAPPHAVAGSGPVPGAGAYRIPPAVPGHGAGLGAGGGGSFLGSIATTAAGVVAGSFLFQGLENLLGHHHGMAGSWNDPAGEHLAEQTVINNYYGSESAEAVDAEREQEPGAFLANDTGDGYADDTGDDADWI